MSLDRSRRFVSAGHPWAALVAFDAALCAAMLNFQYVAVGNEASADAGNGIFLTKEMDGQVGIWTAQGCWNGPRQSQQFHRHHGIAA